MRNPSLADADQLRQQIRALIQVSDEQRLLHRLHCILLVSQGLSAYGVADCFGLHPRTVERWARAYGRRGAPGLRPERPEGRPSRLDAAQADRLAQDLRAQPWRAGYAELQWSARLLQRHLAEAMHVELGLRQCQRLLRRLSAQGARQAQ